MSLPDGCAFRTLNFIDEFTGEWLIIQVKWQLNSADEIDVLTDLFNFRNVPTFIRSDIGPEFNAEAVHK